MSAIRQENGDEPFVTVTTSALASVTSIAIFNGSIDTSRFLEYFDIKGDVATTVTIRMATSLSGGTTTTAPTVQANRINGGTMNISAAAYTANPTLTGGVVASVSSIVANTPAEKILHPIGSRGIEIPPGGLVLIQFAAAQTLTSEFRVQRA
jgi:hypothetical protein